MYKIDYSTAAGSLLATGNRWKYRTGHPAFFDRLFVWFSGSRNSAFVHMDADAYQASRFIAGRMLYRVYTVGNSVLLADDGDLSGCSGRPLPAFP